MRNSLSMDKRIERIIAILEAKPDSVIIDNENDHFILNIPYNALDSTSDEDEKSYQYYYEDGIDYYRIDLSNKTDERDDIYDRQLSRFYKYYTIYDGRINPKAYYLNISYNYIDAYNIDDLVSMCAEYFPNIVAINMSFNYCSLRAYSTNTHDDMGAYITIINRILSEYPCLKYLVITHRDKLDQKRDFSSSYGNKLIDRFVENSDFIHFDKIVFLPSNKEIKIRDYIKTYFPDPVYSWTSRIALETIQNFYHFCRDYDIKFDLDHLKTSFE